ncbi:uncharacterized protein ZK1073.1-like isoform X2 [Babylonia areolata]|uniref:uncharacterized protein ZK1073.1-like isoform X2 n=1 Tax=Babylonia areolata TaxID=304850 RepID=UPI003FD4EB33
MSAAAMEEKEISAPRVGTFKVHIMGCIKTCQFVVLTVHDLGCNHTMWRQFLQHEAMEEINRRAAFIHVDVPGQEDGAKELPADYNFPTMQSLGEDLVCVLDQLDVKSVIGLGEGAGANIVARFAMAQPDRVLGVVLIHCSGTTASFMESMKDKLIEWKLDQIGMNPTAESYLCLHRFGSFEKAENKDQLQKVMSSFQETLRSKMNPHNLKLFVHAYMKRSNIADSIGKLRCPTLMVTGTKSSFNATVHTLFNRVRAVLDKKKVDFLEVDGVANVLEERPERFAESFLYFLQGNGLVGGVPMPRVQRSASIDGGPGSPPGRTRSMSMEEADIPRGIYSKSPPKLGESKLSTSPRASGFTSSPTKS